jgi:signal transduction histidine kinase
MTLLVLSLVLLFINKFEQFQTIIFVSNIMVIILLTKWKNSIVMISVGGILGILTTYYLNINIRLSIEAIEFRLLYVLVFLSALLIAFVRPKQIEMEKVTRKNEYLEEEIEEREEEMLKAIDLKNEFLRNINHEIRTPLTVMNIAVELERNWDRFKEEDRKEYIKILSQGSGRLMSLVNNILDFSKLESNNLELRREEIDLSKLVEERLEESKKLYKEEMGEGEIVAILEESVIVLGDGYYLGKLIDNLLINSIKYGKGGKVEISVRKNGEVAEYKIRDEGIGIDKSELHKIFAPFIVSSKTKTMAGGRGMGLALCKKVVEVHGGEISAESDGVKGSLFIFRIPLA